jgi:3',5'-cyclic AMP phosphodiesterase CpdA
MMETAEADVLVVSGDLVEEPGARVDLLEVAHRLDSSGIPWVVVPGNHDVAEPGRDGAFGEFFGSYPRVERHAGVDFVLLDSFGGYPVGERTPFERLEAQSQGCYSRGRVGAEQLEAAEARLRGARVDGSEERPRVLVVHHHLADEEAVTGQSHRDKYPTGLMAPCRDAYEVLAWSRKMGVQAAFHGHIHRWWPAYVREDIVALNSGSSTRGRPRPRARLADFDRAGRLVGTWTLELGGG